MPAYLCFIGRVMCGCWKQVVAQLTCVSAVVLGGYLGLFVVLV